MAAALGAALVLPTLAALAIFAGLGLGLALPFIALGFVPALRNRMPRPGAWMVTFQRWLAVPMGLTALALCWLIWRQTGAGGLMFAIEVGVLLIAGAWGIENRLKQGKALAWSALLGVLALIGLNGAKLADLTGQPIIARAGAESFSEASLNAHRAKNTPVFLYFTADWCLTCKVNEKTAIERDEVEAAFKKAGVKVMVGDWSRGDPAITRFLNEQGVSGVPLYLFYPRGGGAAQQLPQVLTPGMLTALTK
jgi:thiol:disulfide interchange protein